MTGKPESPLTQARIGALARSLDGRVIQPEDADYDEGLYDPIYKARTDGALSYRFAVPDLWLNPGDTAQVDDDEFTVDTVIYMVSAGGQTTMEVQESA